MFRTLANPLVYIDASSRQTYWSSMLNQAIIIQDHDHKYLHYFKQQSAKFTAEFVKVLLTC